MILILTLCLFLLGLYVTLTYSSSDMREGFKPRCPNLLIQNGNEIWLKNTNLAEVPGVNPVVFKSLSEYTEFVEWQKSQDIDCPLLYLQKTFDAQNNSVYRMKPPLETAPKSMDTKNQTIGDVSLLGTAAVISEGDAGSNDAMSSDWDGVV